MRDRVRRNLALVERAILASILPGVAGVINASGFFAVGVYTSHMTGNVARIGDELATGHLWLALRSLLFVASFVGGAMISTFLVIYGKRVGGPPYWRPMLFEVALLFVFATVNVGAEHRAHINSFIMTALICCAMGVQNALVTKLSGARIRTTHMTGVVTDIGIETARWLLNEPESRKLRLHFTVLGSFLAGATVGPIAYLLVGHVAMLIPCAVLAALAGFDLWIGLSAHTLGHSTDAPAHTSA
jgi:uncharacterized membrane protein YoaK (UPF0700 family)